MSKEQAGPDRASHEAGSGSGNVLLQSVLTHRRESIGRRLSEAESEKGDAEEGFIMDRDSLSVPHETALLPLAYKSIGIIYGDLGTSPLYTFSAIFAEADLKPQEADIIGAMSLIFWTLTLVALVKYVFIVLHADDRREGGTFALYSNLCRHARISLLGSPATPGSRQSMTKYTRSPSARSKLRTFLEYTPWAQYAVLIVVLLATSMVMGDGVLTPAISVLSAVQGVEIAGPKLSKDVVVWITCIILIILFLSQRFGTSRIGFLFAPILIAWLLLNALIGVTNIATHRPDILQAISPHHIVDYFQRNGKGAWVSLGGVVLCITGVEAMFADMGHFSRASIQVAFSAIVYPCLLLTYFGQAAYLSQHLDDVSSAFYKSIPAPMFWPMLLLATAASVVASQSLISGAFSLIKQSMTLSCCPNMTVVHTSESIVGQIYLPEINYALMVLTLGVVIGFRDAQKLGNAYGFAVVLVMTLTTLLTSLVMLVVWQWPAFLVLLFLITFGSLEGLFLSSVCYKVPKGGWFPVVLAVILLSLMYAWHYGTSKRLHCDKQNRIKVSQLREVDERLGLARVPGIGLFYSEVTGGLPPVMSHFLTTIPAIHQVVVFVTVRHLPMPTLASEERFEMHAENFPNFYRCVVSYGYMESPNHGEQWLEELLTCLVEHVQSGVELVSSPPVLSPPQSPPSGQPVGVSLKISPMELPLPVRTMSLTPGVKEGQQGAMDTTTASKAEPVEGALKRGPVGPRKSYDTRGKWYLGTDPLETLWKARDGGAVYVFSRAVILPRTDRGLVHRLVLNGYRVLKAISQSPALFLGIPYSRLLEVGMVYEL